MFRHQMIDRARLRRSTDYGVKVEGTRVQRPRDYGGYFRCAFIPGVEEEAREEGGYSRRRRPTQVVTGSRDEEGNEIDIRASDSIYVESPVHGSLELQITGTPQLIQRGRVKSGWVVEVQRVDPTAAGG